MRPKRIVTRAPSNIALMKYMGKLDSQKNIPDNPSLSMTLSRLCTVVEVEVTRGEAESRWVAEAPRFRPLDLSRGGIWASPELSTSGRSKVLTHVDRVRALIPSLYDRFGLEWDQEVWRFGQLQFRTANTFPAASGIASSASSFAALTLATCAAFTRDAEVWNRIWADRSDFRRALAQISRLGSGSSCRSFEGPWVYWEGENAFAPVELALPEMAHFVVLIRTQPKDVSSSEAHLRVKTSPLWAGRVDRVIHRTTEVLQAMKTADLQAVSRLAWAELWEMHSLFHTAAQPFTYWEPGTLQALQFLSQWVGQDAGPIVTLDAGPNVHLIVDQKYRDLWLSRLKAEFTGFQILEDVQGAGAQIDEWSTDGLG